MSGDKQPYFPLYVADYLADTGHLSAAEHGAYMLLLMHSWRVGSLPADDRQLARIARMTDRQWAVSRDTLAAFFDDGWVHKRVEIERKKAELKSAARAASGSRGGIAKSLKSRDADVANATILPQQNDGKPLASSSGTGSSSLRSEDKRAERAEFARWWSEWPNKVGKPVAELAFHRARKRTGKSTDELIAEARRYASTKPPDRPWLNPSTWLNQDRWEDEPAAVLPSRSTGPPQRQRGEGLAALDMFIEGAERERGSGENGAVVRERLAFPGR